MNSLHGTRPRRARGRAAVPTISGEAFRLWAARRTVGMHVEPAAPGPTLPHDAVFGTAPGRVTGRCAACPDDDLGVCPALRCALRRLLDYGGIRALDRVS